MTQVSDNFVRANGALGPNWSAVIPNTAENGPNTFQGGILINGNGYGPISPFGGDAAALWQGGGSFQNDQWAQATINSVAANTATLHITAATQSGGNTTYTYTVTQGSVTAPVSGGFLYVVIVGMQNAGNNGMFVSSTFGSGTFTVANASGVTESGSNGTGSCPSDSGAGVMIRGSGTTAATLNGYFFHAGTNSFGGNRIAYQELWKIVNGVGTNISGLGSSPQPVVGDVITITAIGTTISAYYNGVLSGSAAIDASVLSGVPGITSWSLNGPGEYNFSTWSTQPTASGNNGTTLNNFSAGDFNFTEGQLASDSLLEGGSLPAQFTVTKGSFSTDSTFGAYATSLTSGWAIAYQNTASWPANQYAKCTMTSVSLVGGEGCGPIVRASTSGAITFYMFYQRTDGNNARIAKVVNGTYTDLATVSHSLAQGDVFEIQAFGSLLVGIINGTRVLTAVDTSLTSGAAGFFSVNATGNPAIPQGTFKNWSAGSISYPAGYSVPDCRVAPFGPNAFRTVQNTKIYDVQTSSNHAIPPIDSRTAGAPVDSRATGLAPQNSRTPGTYGPGE